jgi:hypothetical protein
MSKRSADPFCRSTAFRLNPRSFPLAVFAHVGVIDDEFRAALDGRQAAADSSFQSVGFSVQGEPIVNSSPN